MRRAVSFILFFLLIISLCACGKKEEKASVPEALVGSWDDDRLYTTFPVAAIDINSDGSATIYMDHTYTGHIVSKSGKYEIIVDDTAGSAVAGITVEEVKKAYKITAELSGDGKTLTIFIKAKSGYYYMGDESQTFKKQ